MFGSCTSAPSSAVGKASGPSTPLLNTKDLLPPFLVPLCYPLILLSGWSIFFAGNMILLIGAIPVVTHVSVQSWIPFCTLFYLLSVVYSRPCTLPFSWWMQFHLAALVSSWQRAAFAAKLKAACHQFQPCFLPPPLWELPAWLMVLSAVMQSHGLRPCGCPFSLSLLMWPFVEVAASVCGLDHLPVPCRLPPGKAGLNTPRILCHVGLNHVSKSSPDKHGIWMCRLDHPPILAIMQLSWAFFIPSFQFCFSLELGSLILPWTPWVQWKIMQIMLSWCRMTFIID